MIEQKVKYKNDLKELITKLSIDHVVGEKINLIDQIKNQHNFIEHDQLTKIYAELIQKNQSIIDNIKVIIDRTDNEIEEIVRNRYKDINKNIDIVPNAQLIINEEIESIILTRIAMYSQLKYPGLQLNCMYNFTDPVKWVSSMVANDPLYLAGPYDDHGEIHYLENMISPYPEIYQKRLRLYGIRDRNLDVLPQAQFGLILSWNFFNYQTLDTIEIYLSKIINLLRPGGVFMFSYNNCNLANSAQLFDNQKASWATPEVLEKMFKTFGFEVVEFKDIIPFCSWVEVRRSGELTTVKRSQSLGTIGRK
jgi:SAM-dependent methyltransferase